MLRVIRELSPTWVVGENVAGLLSINDGVEIENIITDLENEGYEVIPALYPAAGVGAPHRRDRVFIVAHSGRLRRRNIRAIKAGENAQRERTADNGEIIGSGSKPENVADTINYGHDGAQKDEAEQIGNGQDNRVFIREHYWKSEPDVGRVANGISNRVDRLRCLGNAVVPQQAYPIFKAIAEVSI
jgi:DNA (cytosine-5)-methyltransferase 1